jgi:uncharacterized protein (DUF952 family)
VADTLLHIAESDAWARRSDTYVPDTFDHDGFIHCSDPSQLDQVAQSFYPGRDDLILLTIDKGMVAGLMVYEDLDGAGELFPHIYGPVPVEAVIAARPYAVVR